MEDLDKKYIEGEENPTEPEEKPEESPEEKPPKEEPEKSEETEPVSEEAKAKEILEKYMSYRPEVEEVIKLASQGYSQREIASMLGVSKGTVHKWTALAKKAGYLVTPPKVSAKYTTITKAPSVHGTLAAERVARMVEKEIAQEALEEVAEVLSVGRIVKDKVMKIAEAYGYSVSEVVEKAVDFWLDWHGILDDLRKELEAKDEYIQILEHLLSLRSDELKEAINQLLDEFHYAMLIKYHLPVLAAYLIYLGLPVKQYLFEYVRYYLDILKEVREYGRGSEGCLVEG